MPDEGPKVEIIPPSLPVLYETAAKYTHKTSAITPLLIPALSALAVMGIEWTSLKYIEDAPAFVVIATFVISAFVLAVLQYRDWLNFKHGGLFFVSISGLFITYVSICLSAYLYLREPPPPNPAVQELQSKLAEALRARDITISEFEGYRREHDDNSASSPTPAIPQNLKKDDIDARLDAWNGLESQIRDLDRILADGDTIITNLDKITRDRLSSEVNKFKIEIDAVRFSLQNFMATNGDFSDLKIVDQRPLNHMSQYINNCLSAIERLPSNTTQEDIKSQITPFIGPIKRQIAELRQWSISTNNLASSSILDLQSREHGTK